MAIKFSVTDNGQFNTLHVEGGPCSQEPRSYVVDSVIINGRIVAVGDGIGATIMVDTSDTQIEQICVYYDGERCEYCDNVINRSKYKPETTSRVDLDQSLLDWFQSMT